MMPLQRIVSVQQKIHLSLQRLWVSPRQRLAIGAVGVIFVAGAGWAAFQNNSPVVPQMASMLPQGALLTIEAKDFAGLLKRWNESPQKAAWLKSDNYSVFSNSRLFGRLGGAQDEFAQTAGLPPDMNFLNEVAGTRSIFAWYDIGNLEFLYITRMPSGAMEKTRLMQTRGKFSRRQAGGQTFYVKTGGQETDPQGNSVQGQARTVAFATAGDWLVLGTREDLVAGALTLMGKARTAETASDSVVGEPWFADARAAAPQEPGDLRMTLNLEKIVPSPYFRHYWVQQNITEMKQYRSAVSDLYAGTGDFREERVLLAKSTSEDAGGNPDLKALTALLPAHAGVWRAVSSPGVDAALASVDEKLLQRRTGVYQDMRIAPQGDVSVPTAGSTGDLETRIDAEDPTRISAHADPLTALRQTLADSSVEAMMTVSRTGEATDGIWIPFQSAVVLSSTQEWNAKAIEDALRAAMQARLTAGGLGVEWKTVQSAQGSYEEMGLARPLAVAVRGRLCLLADDPALMQEMLEHASRQPNAASGKALSQATMLAGFDLGPERGSFARWSALVDRSSAGAGPKVGDGAGGTHTPAFFSDNMRGLGDVFSALDGERFAESRNGPLTRQTVTYLWQH